MSANFRPQLPRPSADIASPSGIGAPPPPRATPQRAHSDLASRAQRNTGAETSLAPRNQIRSPAPGNQEPRGLLSTALESMTHAVRHPSVQSMSSGFQQLGELLMRPFMPSPGFQATEVPVTPPAATQPYVAPSVAGYQCVPLAEMGAKGARAALLAMDLSPQFLDAMKADLDRASTPASKEQFVQTYGQLVAMPNGLDGDTVGALKRMLKSPEPSTPPTAQAAQPRQTLPVMEMTTEDARAALRAMEVAPQVLARMTEDMLNCIGNAGSREGEQLAQQFRRDHGHLLALPQHLDETTLSTLFHLLIDLDKVEPQAEPHSARRPETPPPQQPLRIALHTMEPADAPQALAALLERGVPDQQLVDMAGDLENLLMALTDISGQAYTEQAQKFAQTHGHLIELPAPLEFDTLYALAHILKPYLKEEIE